MDYIAIRIAILLWLVRPQDWVSGMAGFGFMTYAMLAALVGVARRSGGFQIRQLLLSPVDWVMAAYLVWIIYATGDYIGTARALIPSAAFYFCTALALNSSKRLCGFISCWVAGLAIVSVFALSTHYGFELAPGSSDLTQAFAERLTLNTWIYNNPNALGHGVVALIPLAYVWLVWRRTAISRVLGFLAIVAAAQTVYLTQSKGAYMSGAAAIIVGIIFRKAKMLQIGILALAFTIGMGALQLLPRMETLDDKEAGIAGRLIIWQMAHNAMRNTVTGEGWKQFQAWVDIPDYGTVRKATHGSFANIGADLGYPGLFLFVGILCAGARTLYQARPPPTEDESGEEDDNLERCQRALLSLLASFAASAWMIDRAYHTDYFILAGAIAAFHRLLTLTPLERAEEGAIAEADTVEDATPVVQPVTSAWMPSYIGAPALAHASMTVLLAAPHQTEPGGHGSRKWESDDEAEEAPREPLPWRKLDQIDLAMMTAAFFVVDWVWQKAMTDFISF